MMTFKPRSSLQETYIGYILVAKIKVAVNGTGRSKTAMMPTAIGGA